MSRALLIVAAICGLTAAGCGGGGDSSGSTSSSPVARPSQTAADGIPGSSGKAAGEAIQVGSTNFGKILVDGANRPLYLFTRDGQGPSRCAGDCARAWPPFLTKGAPQAGPGAKVSLVGTRRRSDGRSQVTYKGQPVYYYNGDAPGVVRCQNVNEFGGTWYILDATGTAIRD